MDVGVLDSIRYRRLLNTLTMQRCQTTQIKIKRTVCYVIFDYFHRCRRSRNISRLMNYTSSSTVTERPRDALCPSVVSFNGTVPRAQSFIIVTSASGFPLRTIKCCSVVFGVTLMLLVINTSSSSPVKKQKLSYRKQIARKLRTQFVEGISVTLKSTLRVTQGHWKRNHWTDHTRLTVRRVIGR